MPRKPRYFVPAVAYHLIPRFVGREWFFTNEFDRSVYLELLARALKRTSWICLGYALMSSHVHLMMVAGHERLAHWLRPVHTKFAEHVNRTRKRIGSVFVRGPRDILIPDAGIPQVLAYIHNNPVRGGVVTHARDTTWTSHRAYIGAAPVPQWLRVDEALRRGRISDGAAFETLVAAPTPHPILGPAENDDELEARIDAYDRATFAATATAPCISPSKLLNVVANELHISVSQLRSPRRGPLEVQARSVVIACGVQLGYTTSQLAGALAVTPQAVTKALRDGRAARQPVLAAAERALTRFERK